MSRIVSLCAVVLVLAGGSCVPSSAAGAAAPVAPVVYQSPTVMIVVDTSGSMAEDDGTGRIKIEGARVALLDFLRGVEPATRLGLRTYPKGDSCDSGRQRFPLGTAASDMEATVRTLAPAGDTPTAEALTAAAQDLRTSGATNPMIILVSDGEHTCDDPCAAAKTIESSGVDIDVITVGFQISDVGAEELKCIADATGGEYVPADDSERLEDVLGDLSRPDLSVTLQHPTQVTADVGTSGAGTVTVTASITNESDVEARQALALIRFDSGSPGVVAPVRNLGNLSGRQAVTTQWQFRPGPLLIGTSVRFTVVVRALGARQDAQASGEVAVVDGARREDAGPALHDAKRIAILGDSYSSGEGAHRYLGDDKRPEYKCHRSADTYMVDAFDIPDELIIACSGAVAADITAANEDRGVESQTDQLSTAQEKTPVDAVVMSLGGNNIGFGSIAASCVVSPIGCNKRIGWSETKRYVDSRLEALPALLLSAYGEINQELNGRRVVKRRGAMAPIIVIGYPRIVPGAARPARATDRVPDCGSGDPDKPRSDFDNSLTSDEVVFINDLMTRLNGAIEGAVDAARQQGVPVFYVATTEDAFWPDHTICDARPWANPVALLDEGYESAELMHPNREGYAGLTRAIIRWSQTDAGRAAGALSGFSPVDPPNSGLRLAAARSNEGRLTAGEDRATVSDGGTFTVNAAGFAPGAPVEISISSDTVTLRMTAADEGGIVESTVTIPEGLAGEHVVHVVGAAAGGGPRDVKIPVAVADSDPVPVVLWLSIVALVSLLLGLLLLRLGRRRG